MVENVQDNERVRVGEITSVHETHEDVLGYHLVILLSDTLFLYTSLFPCQIIVIKPDGGVFLNSFYTQLPISTGMFLF